ncbi:MAG: alpha/beta hydrolase, partial [Thermomicrobiales bacterium]
AESEGAQIAFSTRGQGDPLVLIPGAPGEAVDFDLVVGQLAADYTVITYDPRGFGESKAPEQKNYEIGQQARDVAAVLDAAGYDRALVFGTSAGALVGLEFAKNNPARVAGLIAHEPPAVRVLADAEDLQARIAEIYLTAWREGPKLALLEFLVLTKLPANNGKPFTDADIAAIKPNIDSIPLLNLALFYVPYQMLPLTNYGPDVETIRQAGVSVVMAAGEQSLDAPFGRTAKALSEQFGGPFVTFPGGHSSYLDPSVTDAWLASLHEALGKL